ncbi:unnamed protein product [Symbiodinium microadriaticum]|nr:unnamed protein product [Symbiodinium microadriaticum]CAE7946210.1 unnamed protein product [Symbiodinium sp. KB8]
MNGSRSRARASPRRGAQTAGPAAAVAGAGGRRRRRKGCAGREQLGFRQYQQAALRVTRSFDFQVSKRQDDAFHPNARQQATPEQLGSQPATARRTRRTLNDYGAGARQSPRLVLEYINDHSHPAMQRMSQFFKENAENDRVAIIDTGSAARPATGTDWQRRYVAAIGKGLPALETEHRTRGSAASMRTAGTRRLELCLELLDDGVARGDCRSTHLLDSGAAPFLSLRAQHWHTPSSSGRPGWTADSEHRPGTWQPHHRDRNHNDGPPDDGDSRDLDNEHGDNNIHDQTGAYLAIDNLRYQAMTNGMVAEVGRKQSRMLAQRTASYGTRLPDFEERSGDTMSFHVAAGPFCSSCLLEQPCFHMRLHVPMGSLILPNPSASLTGSGSSWQTCTRERNKWTPMIKMSRANDRRSGGKFSTNTRGGVLSVILMKDDGTSPGTLEETAEPQLPRHSWRHELPGKGFLENGCSEQPMPTRKRSRCPTITACLNNDMAVDVFIVKGIRRAKFKFFAVVENGTPSGWLVNAIAWQLAGREAMEMLVVEATSVKNNRLPDRLHHAGFASFQWVLDRLPAEAGSFTATGGAKCLGQHQETEDGETDVTNHKTGDDSRSSSSPAGSEGEKTLPNTRLNHSILLIAVERSVTELTPQNIKPKILLNHLPISPSGRWKSQQRRDGAQRSDCQWTRLTAYTMLHVRPLALPQSIMRHRAWRASECIRASGATQRRSSPRGSDERASSSSGSMTGMHVCSGLGITSGVTGETTVNEPSESQPVRDDFDAAAVVGNIASQPGKRCRPPVHQLLGPRGQEASTPVAHAALWTKWVKASPAGSRAERPAVAKAEPA